LKSALSVADLRHLENDILNPVSGAPPWLPRDFALLANQRRALPMKKSWPSKMRKKTACFGWYGRVISIWFDRPKSELRQLASGQNPSASRWRGDWV